MDPRSRGVSRGRSDRRGPDHARTAGRQGSRGLAQRRAGGQHVVDDDDGQPRNAARPEGSRDVLRARLAAETTLVGDRAAIAPERR